MRWREVGGRSLTESCEDLQSPATMQFDCKESIKEVIKNGHKVEKVWVVGKSCVKAKV